MQNLFKYLATSILAGATLLYSSGCNTEGLGKRMYEASAKNKCSGQIDKKNILEETLIVPFIPKSPTSRSSDNSQKNK